MIPVSLTFDEIKKGLDIAHARWAGKEDFASTRNYSRYQTSEQVHQMGTLGEVAVAKYYGWEVDDQIAIQGDSGVDFIIRKWKVDVQTTKYYPPHLKYDSKHPFRADAAILVYQESESEYKIAGWIMKEEFDNRCVEHNYGYGIRKVVPIARLNAPAMDGRISKL